MKKALFTLALFFTFFTNSASALTGWVQDYLTLNVNGTGSSYYWIGTNPDYGTQFNIPAGLGTVSSLVITGCDMRYWSDTQDRTGGSFFYSITSADGSTTYTASTERVWSHASLGGNNYQGTLSGLTIDALNSIPVGTACNLIVYAKSWGSGQGDSWLSNGGSNYVATFTKGAVAISGANGITDGTSYTTIKGAFDAINAQTNQSGKNIVITVSASTTETATASLTGTATTWTSLKIYPTNTGLSISGNLAAPLIDLNSADNVTLDGRVNATGSAKDLIITNTSTSATAGTSTIRLYNGANANTIQYCTVKGSTMATSDGVIRLAATSGFTGYATANTTNLIDNNNITNSADANRPLYAIYSASAANTITISNNNIYDFFNRVNASRGINFTTTGAISIIGNSFYETTSFVTATGVGAYNAIYSNNATAVAIGITGNYFGGNAANVSGTWTKTGVSNIFAAISLVGSGPTYTVQTNTISNINWSNTGSDYWKGIIVPNGAATIGGAGLGNTISNITLTNTISGGTFTGISLAGTTGISCNYNTIQAITTANDAANATNFIGIDNANTGSGNQINYNTIGHASNANSINASSASSSNAQTVVGIQNTGSSAGLAISNNIIANLTNGTSNVTEATVGYICGIFNTGNAILTINANRIHHLTIANANTASDHTASVSGIAMSSSSPFFTTTNNSIYNLSNTYASFIGYIYGAYLYGGGAANNYSDNTIYNLSSTSTAAVNITGVNFYSGIGANTVNKNFIYGISAANSSSAIIIGILKRNGVATLSNNIISLGTEAPATIYGIYDLSAAANHSTNLYFNTIYIGSTVAGGALNSYALYSTASTNTRNFRNNILQNSRSNNGASGKHYAAFFNYGVSTALTLDYNDYYVTGTGGVLGYYNGGDVASLPLISTLDVNSMTINPALASAGGVLATNYKPTSDKLGGLNISTVPNDYAVLNRAASPTIGAYEVTLNLNVDVYKSNVFQASYFRIKDAFDKINSGMHIGALEVRIKANTTEPASAVLFRSGYTGAGGISNYTSVNIYPTVSGITIAGNIDAHLIDLDGADNVTIDGRVNATGSTKDLVITNTSTGANTASTIRFYGSAENNTVKYCTIKGSGSSTVRAIVYFAQSINGNGNDENVIDHNNITSSEAGRPIHAIYSAGASGYVNNNNTISNNNIYDFLRANSNSAGINVFSHSADWTISGNSFYETTIFEPTGKYAYFAITLSSLSKHLISGNYIGGSEPLCAGSAFTVISSQPHYLRCLSITGGTTTETACTVQNNIIRNIYYTSTESNPWDAMYLRSGNINVTGNTIGETTGNGSIQINAPTASAICTLSGGAVTAITMNGGGSGYTTIPVITFSAPPTGGTAPTASASISGGAVTVSLISGGSGYVNVPVVYFDGMGTYSTSHGLNNYSAGTVSITNNSLGSITTAGSTTYSHGIETIYVSGTSGTYTISNNLVGSLSTANSIQSSTTAASSLQKQDVYGIYSACMGTTLISGNTIANLTNQFTGTNQASRARGIHTSGGSNTIQNNTIRNISTASAQTGGGSNVSLIGLSQASSTAGTTQIIKGNTIYNLSNTNAAARVLIFGLYYAGPTTGIHSISGNFIHSLSLSTTDVGATIYGIALNSGVATCSNNIVNLGANTLGYIYNGIWDGSVAGHIMNVYFNTVYIGGSVTSGVTSSTAALNNANNTSTRDYRNNILYNARTGGTTGKHYAVVLAGTANTTIDYNDYFFVGSMLGKIGTLEKADLAAWKLGTSQDVNSLSTNPNFAIAGGTNALDYYSTATIPGTSSTSVTIDYDGLTRGTTPKMGALEYNNYTWTGNTNNNFATASNWAGGEVPPNGANISFTANPSNHCLLDQNRSLKNITNGQGAKYLVLNGKQLTLTGDLIFTNSAKIDGTTALSSIVYAGALAQTVPTGSFLNNTVDSLTINNPSGLTLNSDFTIEKAIALIDGNFAIGPNTLTFNGDVTAMTGTVTGGSSTNMIIGGTGSTISMPTFTLNNLTINRASGVALYGNLNLAGTLTLTNGLLTIGSNTLTLSSTPIRTSGSIDASNATASIIFSNASAISLPASIFSAAVNNLSLTGVGGITSPSDFTVNGELNLTVPNPSATKGLLDMWDGSTIKTLTMGATATTIGLGDVTGIVTRNYFEINNPYSFGNEFTTINMADGGALPTSMSVKISLSSDHTWKTNAIHRYYDIIQIDGSSLTTITTNLHYLDSELNGATVGNMDLFDYHKSSATPHLDDHGRSNDNSTNKWVGLSNMSLTYIARSAFDQRYWTLGNSTASNFTWLGAVDTDWNNTANWVGGVVPATGNQVVIPDASTTPFDPELPATATIGYLQVQEGGILNGGTNTVLTIDGGYLEGGSVGSWDNMGTFNAGTSTVIFTSPTATMSDPTNFYNVSIAENAKLTLGTGNVMRIAGELTLAGSGLTVGVLNAANTNNIIEFNGVNQTIVNPNGLTSGYYNLILSGSGTKTLPSTALTIYGDFTSAGTTTVNAGNALTIDGSIDVVEGSTFVTGSYNHTIKGDIHNHGTFTATTGSEITMNGSSSQLINGVSSIDFDKLTINNSQGVTLMANENVNGELSLTSGNLNIGTMHIGINGSVSKSAGYINTIETSSLTFGGTEALTLPDNLFSSSPSINNLTVNRSGGVTLGNQNMTINGLLDLSAGTLTIAANTLTLTGSSPIRTSGNIDASNAAATLVFANPTAIVLPASIFAGNVNNFTISSAGIGGVTASSDFTINGILSLQCVNPSDTKGSLEMTNSYGIYPGTTNSAYLDSHILTMGATATTVGIGDVTGTVKRNTLVQNTSYSFGNQYTTISLSTGTMPTALSVTITIGTSVPAANGTDVIRDGIKRSYEIVPTVTDVYTSTSTLNANFHYLDSELTSSNSPYHVNSENNMVTMDYDIEGSTSSDEHGRSTYDFTNNFIGLSNVPIAYFINKTDHAWRTIFTLRDYSTDHYTWNGSQSSVWGTSLNWTPTGVPSDLSHVIIPDISTTLYQCVLAPNVTINTMTIENGGAMTMGSETLTIKNSLSGGWEDQNAIGNNPGTSTVIFSMPGATLSGTSRFYNVEISSGATLTNQTANTMKIANTITRTGIGKWYADFNGATIDYNGAAQTIALTDGTPHYHNLTLSGSGVKTLPVAPLSLHGNLSLSGTASTIISDSVYVGGNVALASGTSLTISPTKILNVAGTISNNAGVNALVIKSSSTQANGSLIYHNAYNSPVQATVEMYSKASKPSTSSKWQFFGIPLRTMTFSPTFDGSYVRQMHEDDIPLHWYQINQYNVPASFINLNSFTGYEITQVTPRTIYFKGELENKDFSSGKLAYTTGKSYPGQHLIGNPYTAAIDISKIEFGSTDPLVMLNTVYLYNTGSFADWTNAGAGAASDTATSVPGQYLSVPKSVAGRNGLPSQIPSMQAFVIMVKSENASATISFPYSSIGTVIKNTSLQRATAVSKISTRINVQGTGYGDNVWLITEPSCTSAFDNGWDGYKSLYSGVTQLYAMETSGNYQVNSVDNINQTYLGFQAGSVGNYTLTFKHENMESQYPALYLIDLMNNDKVTDITFSGSQYTFYASNTSSAQKRFKIVTSLNGVTENKVIMKNVFTINNNGNTIFIHNLAENKGDLVLFDIAGRVIQQIPFAANTVKTIHTNLTLGMYLLKASCGDNQLTYKIVIE